MPGQQPADVNLQKLTYRVMFRQSTTPDHPYSQHVSLLGPLPWSNQDVGQVGLAGSATHFSEADLTVNGAGTDIGGTADAMHFAYRSWSGDFDIVAQLLGVQSTDPGAKVGVMSRESLTANAKQALMVFAANGALSFLRRTSAGGSTTATSGGTSSTPTWVRLTRAGKTVTGYRSVDGIAWTKVGSSSITMAANIYVGVAVTSKNSSLLAAANVDRVSIRKP